MFDIVGGHYIRFPKHLRTTTFVKGDFSNADHVHQLQPAFQYRVLLLVLL